MPTLSWMRLFCPHRRGEGFESHLVSRCGSLSEQWAHGLAGLGPESSIKHQQTPLSHCIVQLTGPGDPPRLVSVRAELQEKAS